MGAEAPSAGTLFGSFWPSGTAGHEDELYSFLDRHRLVPLAWEHLGRLGGGVPEPFRTRFRTDSARLALGNDRLDSHLSATLALLVAAGVTPLVIKGSALGQTHYGHSGLRPRSDTDLLVAEADRDKAVDALLRAGFRQGGGIDGRLVTCQVVLVQEDPPGFPHVYDLHWRISNRQAVAARLSYQELLDRAIRVPALGPHARAPCAVDALLLACAHRAAHHADHERLIWLYDIHLLVESLSEAELDEFVTLAIDKQLSGICKAGIYRAQELFGTRHPALDAWLSAGDPPEPLSRALLAGHGHLGGLGSDLRALNSWADQGRLLREHLFPSARYMRDRYGIRHRWLLPLAYGHRIVKGFALALGELSRRFVGRRRPKSPSV
ncbi:MAG: nucleotidyltransferase family protein [Anaerolineae bacterium]